MRLALFGDVVGRAGREALVNHLPSLRQRLGLDFVVVNAENAAGGFGITRATAESLFDAGTDVITLGNHAFDQPEALTYLDREARLIRPCNYPLDLSIPGRGTTMTTAANGARVLVINVMGRLFMDPLDDPFVAVERELTAAPLRQVADVIVIDMHAEATSEKYAMGHAFDGRASVVVGTHTHVPTADAQILPGGTAYQTDLGMCGDYDSVIGMNKHISVEKFTTRLRGPRNQPAEGEATICGLMVDVNTDGLAAHVAPIRVGGRLSATLPPERQMSEN